MRRKVNNSEIHEIKRYCEVPSEKVQEWSDTIENLTKQRDQFKAERDKFEQMLNKECECGFQIEGEYHDMKAERDTLIDDLKTLRKKHEALEASENSLWLSSREFERERDELAAKVSRLERENKDLRLQSDTYFEQWQQHKALNNEISQHIGNKPSSNKYKYFRGKLDGIGIKEGADDERK